MELPDNWEAVNGTLRQRLGEELSKEVTEGHALFAIETEAVAARRGTDLDVLFRFLDGSERYAIVHLTWSKLPDRPPIPWADIYNSYKEFTLHSNDPV